jgi:hypothetical protein
LEDLPGNLRAKVRKTFWEIEPRFGRPSGKSQNKYSQNKSFRKYIFQENPQNFPKDFGHLKLTDLSNSC